MKLSSKRRTGKFKGSSPWEGIRDFSSCMKLRRMRFLQAGTTLKVTPVAPSSLPCFLSPTMWIRNHIHSFHNELKSLKQWAQLNFLSWFPSCFGYNNLEVTMRRASSTMHRSWVGGLWALVIGAHMARGCPQWSFTAPVPTNISQLCPTWHLMFPNPHCPRPFWSSSSGKGELLENGAFPKRDNGVFSEESVHSPIISSERGLFR